jgi:ABC-type sulfate/molybdate transport systems ATPase subunit
MTTRRGLRPAPILTTNDKEKRDMASIRVRPTEYEITTEGNEKAPLVVKRMRHSPGVITIDTTGPFIIKGQDEIDQLARRLRKYLRDEPFTNAGDDTEEETHG